MPGIPTIVSSRTRSQYERQPNGPFVLNQDSPLARGLVAWWPLGDQNPRDYRNWATNRTVLTQNNSPAVKSGVQGGFAPTFNGSTQNLELPTTAILTGFPVSLSAWANSTTITAEQVVVGITNGDVGDQWINIEFRGDVANDPFRAQVHDHTGAEQFATTTSGYAANQWYHICGTFALSSWACYLNGGSKGTNTTAYSPTGLSRTGIGSFHVGASHFSPFSGGISDVCVHNRVLSDAEVYALYSPATRWDLYFQTGTKTWVFFSSPPPPPPGGFQPAWGVPSSRVLSGGVI